MALTRWDAGGARTLRDQLNRVFEDVMTPALRGGLGLVGPTVDVYQKGSDLVIEAELPGVDLKDVEITATENSVTLTGESHREEEVRDENMFRSERRWGSFVRTVELPGPIDPDNAKASFNNGVLTILAPLLVSKKGRRVDIEGREATGSQSERT